MNKKTLANELAKRANLSQVKAMEVLNLLFDANPGKGIIADELASGNKVTIPGFGTFGTKWRARRIGTDPATHKRIQIPARLFTYFKDGKILRERIREVGEGQETSGGR